MTRKHILALSFFLLVFLNPSITKAQFIPKKQQNTSMVRGRFYWESSFGLQIGSITNIEIAPGAGYTLAKNLYTGVSGTYIYYQNNYYVPAFKTHIYGGSIYLRYMLFEKFLLQGEYQLLNYQGYDDFTGEEIRRVVPGYLLGAGYRQWFNEKIYGDIWLLWNFNDVNDYPYGNPILRITFGGFWGNP